MQLYDKKLVYRAGVIPYVIEDNQIKMMFMVPSDPTYGGSLPQIAKGRVEDGETTEAAGLREAQEELGLFIGNIKRTEELGVFMGRTTVYVSKVKDRDMFGSPCFETSDVKWMTLEEFMVDGRPLHVPVVQAAVRMITRMEESTDVRYT
jgi:8-oxo-dGTP pyrophosphatase MutT (NUDIX family)